jgi:glycosyltransferase involved in cell wall biosynthesis
MSRKIVIDARESGTTTGRYIDKLIEHMDKLEPQHQIIVLTHAERTEFFANAAPNFVIVQTPFKEFSFDEQIGFLRQLRGLKADLVHFGMVQQPVMYHGDTITTMHDLTTARFTNPDKNPVVFKMKQLVYKWVNKTAARKSAAIITPTQFVKDDVAQFAGINPEKITVTYEAADFINDAPEAIPGLEGKQFIMYLGRPTPHKNLARLIDAFKELQQSHPDLHLVLAGKKDANYRRHEARVAAEQITNITFTDFISEGQLRWLYQNCAAYIFPSLSEGFGLPGLEAMVHGAPVVSSNATCLPEVYGDAAHYFDPLSVNDMATQIAAVIDDADTRSKLIEKGAKQAKKYSWDHMARQTLDLYQSVLDNANL